MIWRPLHARKFDNRLRIEHLKLDQLGRVFVLLRRRWLGGACRKPPAFHDPHFEVYDHHDYTEDKKAAMEGLAALVAKIVEGSGSPEEGSNLEIRESDHRHTYPEGRWLTLH